MRVPYLLVLVWCAVPHAAGSGQTEPPADGPALAPRPKAAPDTWVREYRGSVKSLTKNSLTIAAPGYWEETAPIDARGRSLPELATRKWYPPPPPREFFVRWPLATGRLGDRDPDAYRFSDVKVGDDIRVRCEFVNGENVCAVITINRRPGGKVPPSPNYALFPDSPVPPHHERMNALADRDERGIPIPERLRRWLEPTPQPLHPNGPEGGYPGLAPPTAPQPREVGVPRIPTATP